MKDSKALGRFQQQAKSFDSYISPKKDEEIERLVSLESKTVYLHPWSLTFVISLVLADFKELSPCLWRRCLWLHV